MTIFSEGRVLRGKSLKAAVDHSYKAKQLASTIEEADRAQQRFLAQIRAEIQAANLELENAIKADLGMSDEDFAGWVVLNSFTTVTGVAVMVKIETPAPIDSSPQTGLN